MFSQNSGVVSKQRARRSAVSPVIARRSAMIAWMRVTARSGPSTGDRR